MSLSKMVELLSWRQKGSGDMDNYYNPYQQQRPMYQPQQRPMYQPQQMTPQQDMFNVRVAASREEAAATPMDFFRTTVILGLNHGMIYIKRFNQETGETIFEGYERAAAVKPPEYVTVESFDAFKGAVAQALNQMRGVEQSE